MITCYTVSQERLLSEPGKRPQCGQERTGGNVPRVQVDHRDLPRLDAVQGKKDSDFLLCAGAIPRRFCHLCREFLEKPDWHKWQLIKQDVSESAKST